MVLLSGQSAVEGACDTVSRVALGEEVLSTITGLPFFQAVFVGVPNLPLFQNDLRQALLQVDGVLDVGQVTASLSMGDNGKQVLKYTALIRTKYGLQFKFSGSLAQ